MKSAGEPRNSLGSVLVRLKLKRNARVLDIGGAANIGGESTVFLLEAIDGPVDLIERNPHRIQAMKDKFGDRVRIIADDFDRIEGYTYDLIVCSPYFAGIPKALERAATQSFYDRIAPGGHFITYGLLPSALTPRRAHNVSEETRQFFVSGFVNSSLWVDRLPITLAPRYKLIDNVPWKTGSNSPLSWLILQRKEPPKPKAAAAKPTLAGRYKTIIGRFLGNDLEAENAQLKAENIKLKKDLAKERVEGPKLLEARTKRFDELRNIQRAKHAEGLRQLRIKIRSFEREIGKAERFEYGSFTPGQAGWREKWDKSSGKRVLLYALRDYSGSFYKWAAALHQHTDYAVRLVTMDVHRFKYPMDLVMPFGSTGLASDFETLVKESDIVHIKDETGFLDGNNTLPADFFSKHDKPLLFTHYGGYARKHAEDPAYIKFVQGFQARLAMTPDLAFDWFAGFVIPHAIDTDVNPYTWTDGRLISHSPSTEERKGTADLVEAVQGLDLDLEIIQGVPFDECIARKKRANLFFDQSGRENVDKLGVDTIIGWYGNSAIEAAVYGIPTIAHLSQTALERLRRSRPDQAGCAIINTPPGAEGIRQTLSTYLRLSSDERAAVSRNTRLWIENFHSYQSCAAQLAKVYDAVRKHGKASPEHL